MIKNTDLAYIAGYIDGDGCFFITRRKKKYKSIFDCRLIIVSTNKTFFYEIKNVFGGSIHTPQKTPAKQKNIYRYTLCKQGARKLTELILPYLVQRQDEAKVFLQACNEDIFNRTIVDSIKKSRNSCLVSSDLVEQYNKEKNTILPTNEDIAFFAGFIDAECCLTLQRYKRKNYIYKPLLVFNDTKYKMFQWIVNRFGGFVMFINRTKYARCKNQMRLVISSKSLYKILPKILCYLKHKKPVCEELIKFEKTVVHEKDRHSDKFRSDYANILFTRETIFNKIHKLNSKGIST